MQGWIKHRDFSGTGWPTTPPSGCSPSSTAASTMASLWSTIVRTTWCHRTRGGSFVDNATLSWLQNSAFCRTSTVQHGGTDEIEGRLVPCLDSVYFFFHPPFAPFLPPE